MAELFLARDTRNGRMVVLKRILPYLAEEGEFVRMFLDEARIAAALHHPNIVELYELGHLEGSTFIAMEWVDGVDLRRVLLREQDKGGQVPFGVAAWIAARLCEGLFAAHTARDSKGASMGIIHRDVSPQNVMLSFDGDVKLVDFGIAKATAWMDRSKPGVIKGKFLYLAPEQLTTDPLDHRTDLFALGTLLYELTTGQSPFYRTSTEAVIYSIRMEEPDPPGKLRSDFPSELSRIILKCLTKERNRRYQTADEVRAALEDFIRLDAPATREDVQKYVWSLFGDESERTSIYIPPNAQVPQKQQPRAVDRTDTRTDTGTERNNPFKGIDAESTTPMVAPAKDRSRQPEGRRETNEQRALDERNIDAVPTGPTRNERPKARSQVNPVVEENPWGDSDRTVPLSPEERQKALATPRRDFQSTAEIDPPALSDADIPPTAVSVSGAREVAVGEVFRPLVPTLMGDESGAAIQAVKPRVGPKPAPPVPDVRDSIPELSMASVVSAGDATQGLFIDPPDTSESPEPEPDPEPSEPSEPSPVPSTRAPPRNTARPRPAPPLRRATAFGDPDDDIETVDQANEFSVTGRSKSQKLTVGLIIGAVVLAALLVIGYLVFGGSSDVKKPERPPPTQPSKVEPPKVEPPPTTPEPPTQMRVQIRAVRGTQLTLDGRPVAADETLMRPAGELVLKFTCPPKKKGKSAPGTLRAQIPTSEQLVVVEVPCK